MPLPARSTEGWTALRGGRHGGPLRCPGRQTQEAAAGLPPAIRRLIVDLKAEYPRFNLNEIANVVRACFGRKPDVRSVQRVLDEEPVPLKIVRNYPPYHETEDPREAWVAIVELRLSGWSAKTIAGYLGAHHATVYRTLERWKQGGLEGLEDRPFGRPPGVTLG